ncbi:MAG: protein translocase subunit SecD [Novosphingobium sp.]
MLDFPTWKKLWYWGLTLAVAAAALPSLFSVSGLPWPSALPHPQVSLGLDLAGGSHILLEANEKQVAQQRMENMEESVRARLKLAQPRIRIGDISSASGRLTFMLKDPAQVDAARNAAFRTMIGHAAKGHGQTAKLEFKLVDETAAPNDVKQGIAPPGDEIVPWADPNAPGAQGVPVIAVKRLGGIKGDQLTDAKQSFDSRNNTPVVSITFDQQGGAKFAKLTSENVNKRFAIILDGKVLSAPSINEPILGGSAQIQGSFSVQSATQLAIALRSGALPVDLTVVEERTVGPDLGADSIRKGLIAMGVGSGLVVLLMIAVYGRFGIYATIALVFNLMMILGVMAVMGTTLTLPGLAGFVLTIGAAVDANVLIYERMREERKKGRRVIAAVENGYKEASRAIYDANITNFIAGVLLFAFGSGPVRGFAGPN